MKSTTPLTCLGIESSCDDTAAAVVQLGADDARILSNVVLGQNNLHSAFGGVVPEIAARAHAEVLDVAVRNALADSKVALRDIDLIAVTAGPGLIGGVMAGVMCAKGIAAGTGQPLIGVNHLAGHALTPQLTDGLEFPYLLLLVSGGHCQFVIAHDADRFERLGGTIDDAPGEAFDKTARILGLPQPGGPSVEDMAKQGNEKRFKLPRPLLDRDDMNMSFSGLKTAVLRTRDAFALPNGDLRQQNVADLCAGFQASVRDVLVEKSRRALKHYMSLDPTTPAFAVAGGVAANQTLNQGLRTLAQDQNVQFVAPPLKLCTDNAAMIAYAGACLYRKGQVSDMTLQARPRWPLDDQQTSMIGSGKKGPKA
ncbi:MAG: tRNA (adenosine(37)-N6)-threonylcarbamoyltransferase complex transferase subunit TsaD [Planktomarina sp.]